MKPQQERQNNNKKAPPQTRKNPNAGLLWSLIAGTLALFVGLAYGLKTLPTARTSPAVVVTVTDHQPVDVAATIMLDLADAVAVTPIQNPDISMHVAKNNAEVNADIVDDRTGAAFEEITEADPATLARQQELQYLKEVMPDNTMIPTEKSAEELDRLFADFEEHRQLQALIESGKASPAERERYFALRMEKYDEEIALIQLCDDVAANSLANIEDQQAQLCTHVAEGSTERLKIIEESIEELEQQVLFSSRTE